MSKKKILIIGGLTPNYYIVERLKELGYYTIVVDNVTNSPAKAIADESLMISIDDVDAIAEYCINNNVAGILHGSCGFGETYYPIICQKLDLPCFGSVELGQVFGNKYNFKEQCKKNGLSVIETYETDATTAQSPVDFPVVIKPTDSSGSKGVVLCYDAAHFKEALTFASAHSYSGKVIIEKYMTCDQINISICVQNGKAYTSVHDRFAYCDKERLDAITHLMIYPSKYTELYYSDTEKKMQSLISNHNVNNAFLFAQAFVDKDCFRFFDPGMRFTGCQEYLIADKAFGINLIDMAAEYATTGVLNSAYSMDKADPMMNGLKYAVFCYIAGPGTIAKIIGMDMIAADPAVFHVTEFLHEGDTISKLGTTQQTVARIHICCKDGNELTEAIKRLQGMLTVLDIDGKEMLWPGYDKNSYWEDGGLKDWISSQLD